MGIEWLEACLTPTDTGQRKTIRTNAMDECYDGVDKVCTYEIPVLPALSTTCIVPEYQYTCLRVMCNTAQLGSRDKDRLRQFGGNSPRKHFFLTRLCTSLNVRKRWAACLFMTAGMYVLQVHPMGARVCNETSSTSVYPTDHSTCCAEIAEKGVRWLLCDSRR